MISVWCDRLGESQNNTSIIPKAKKTLLENILENLYAAAFFKFSPLFDRHILKNKYTIIFTQNAKKCHTFL